MYSDIQSKSETTHSVAH